MTENMIETIRKITENYETSLILNLEKGDYYIHCFYNDGSITEYQCEGGCVTRFEGREVFEKTATTPNELEISLRECLAAVTLAAMTGRKGD